jgi:hypothetical protein
LYNGRSAREHFTSSGVTWGSIHAQRQGIFTRGVLLDVAAARGVDWIEPDQFVTVADLESAEARQHVRVGSGDALFVRVGLTTSGLWSWSLPEGTPRGGGHRRSGRGSDSRNAPSSGRHRRAYRRGLSLPPMTMRSQGARRTGELFATAHCASVGLAARSRLTA